MTGAQHYVCVDWGTSRLRAALCEFTGVSSIVHDTLSGPGILAARHSIEETLFEVISPWSPKFGHVPVLLAGGVGSNIGWRTTPYLECPFAVRDLADHCTTFSTRGRDIVIVPGIECINSFGETDTMRGEELQILGWLGAETSRQSGVRLICLPGTHTKWVLVEDGRILTLQTAITGELYAMMRDHSILLANNDESGTGASAVGDAFVAGVAACREAHGALSHALFSARSRLMKQRLNAEAAASYLSGLLIAADVMGALDLLKATPERVFLVGDPSLCEHFAAALDAFGRDSETMDGDAAATQGFSVIYEDLYQHQQDRYGSTQSQWSQPQAAGTE